MFAENADERAVRREQTRWKAADGDADGRLSQREFVALVHPELFAHMEQVLVDETLDDMDKNRNGRIERDEFLDDVIKHEGTGTGTGTGYSTNEFCTHYRTGSSKNEYSTVIFEPFTNIYCTALYSYCMFY